MKKHKDAIAPAIDLWKRLEPFSKDCKEAYTQMSKMGNLSQAAEWAGGGGTALHTHLTLTTNYIQSTSPWRRMGRFPRGRSLLSIFGPTTKYFEKPTSK